MTAALNSASTSAAPLRGYGCRFVGSDDLDDVPERRPEIASTTGRLPNAYAP